MFFVVTLADGDQSLVQLQIGRHIKHGETTN
jgi:hypothetical protein